MNELKEHLFCDCNEMFLENGSPLSNDIRSYYLKSEADKVISELKAQKAQAEDDCAYWKMREGNAVNAMHETEEACMFLTKSERHQKYKRCLAKKAECKLRSERYQDLWEKWRKTEYDTSGSYYKNYIKWWHRAMKWKNLAEKFKPTNSTVQ